MRQNPNMCLWHFFETLMHHHYDVKNKSHKADAFGMAIDFLLSNIDQVLAVEEIANFDHLATCPKSKKIKKRCHIMLFAC